MQQYKNLIGGEWVDSSDGETFENRNPANYDEVLGTFPSATKEDVLRAIEAANEAKRGWADMPAPSRGAILDKASRIIEDRADEFAKALTQEEGKTLAEAKGEVKRAQDIFRYYGGEGWRAGGETIPSNTAGELLYTAPRTPGRGSAGDAVEFPGGDPGVEDGPGADLWQHGGFQTGVACAAHWTVIGGSAGAGWVTGGRGQLYHRLWAHGRRHTGEQRRH